MDFDPPYKITSAQWNRRAVLQRTYATRNWIRFHRDLLGVMSPQAALLWSYLMNIAEGHNADKKFNGWFFCTRARIQKEMFMTSGQQKRAFKELIDMDWLVTRKMGIPAKRYIWMELESFEDLLNKSTQNEDNDRLESWSKKDPTC